MRPSYIVGALALTIALTAAALFGIPRLLAPRRSASDVDFAALAVAAARRVEDYGARHGGFSQLRPESVLVALPAGAGLRVSQDSVSATVAVLHDGRPRCTMRVVRGEPLRQPTCTND